MAKTPKYINMLSGETSAQSHVYGFLILKHFTLSKDQSEKQRKRTFTKLQVYARHNAYRICLRVLK